MVACSLDKVSALPFAARNGMKFTLKIMFSWWRHQMETFSALLAICSGNSPVSGEFHKGQWRGAFMFSLACALNKPLSKQSWVWWFETLSRSLWRHCNVLRWFIRSYLLPWADENVIEGVIIAQPRKKTKGLSKKNNVSINLAGHHIGVRNWYDIVVSQS